MAQKQGEFPWDRIWRFVKHFRTQTEDFLRNYGMSSVTDLFLIASCGLIILLITRYVYLRWSRIEDNLGCFGDIVFAIVNVLAVVCLTCIVYCVGFYFGYFH